MMKFKYEYFNYFFKYLKILKKPTDVDLHCLQIRVYPGLAGQGLKKHTVLHLITAHNPYMRTVKQFLHLQIIARCI